MWACYPLLVLFLVVVTANHFWVDGLAGAAVAAVAALVARGPLARLRPQVWAWRVAPRDEKAIEAPARIELYLARGADLVAYLMNVNGFPAGGTELPILMASLAEIRIGREPKGRAIGQVFCCRFSWPRNRIETWAA